MDTFRLQRFVDAQMTLYPRILSELRNGEKRSHWMWFVFPQIAGLGSSAMAREYAISSIDEARAYLAHPLLGARLKECTRLVNAVEGRTISQIFGDPDDLKFHSSMTLFAEAAVVGETQDDTEFAKALDKYFGGVRDQATLGFLHQGFG